jgi:hypothetical protein
VCQVQYKKATSYFSIEIHKGAIFDHLKIKEVFYAFRIGIYSQPKIKLFIYFSVDRLLISILMNYFVYFSLINGLCDFDVLMIF